MSHPILNFKRAYLAMRRALEQTIKPFDFSVAQFDVLQILMHDDGLEHRELQKRLAVASPTLTNVLDRMERDGHVQRRADGTDGRIKCIYLGDQARTLCWSDEFCQAGDKLVESMFHGFSDDEKHLFNRMLARIEKNLE